MKLAEILLRSWPGDVSSNAPEPIHPSDLHMLAALRLSAGIARSPGMKAWGLLSCRSGVKSGCWNSRSSRSPWQTWCEQMCLQWTDSCPFRRPGRFGRRHFLHQSFDCMGIDEIKSQSQEGNWLYRRRLPSTVGSWCFNCAAVSIQDNQRIRRREQERPYAPRRQ